MMTENQVASIQDSVLRTQHSGLLWGVAMKNLFSILLGVTVVVVSAVALAQQPMKISRIGVLSTTSPSNVPTRLEAFRQGLRELGYVEGKNIVIEYRYAEGKPERLPALAAELVSLKVDVIVISGPSPTRAAKEATVPFPLS